ncbi:MAG: hypothetical protein IPI35_15355 [Deltaproteobacteria bacterium]|nr:hypothetical protein [Deltaproteobacteria bacterium]
MDKLRALFVLFHLVGITLLSLPTPGKAQDLDAPEAAALLEDLRALGARLGVERSAAEVKVIAVDVSERIREARAALLAPFNPYARLTGARQGWSMFWAINHRPARLVIELEGPDGAWTPLYVARSDTYDWRRRELDFRAAAGRGQPVQPPAGSALVPGLRRVHRSEGPGRAPRGHPRPGVDGGAAEPAPRGPARREDPAVEAPLGGALLPGDPVRLRALAEAWVAYWAQLAPPTPLALIRVALALCALGTLAHMIWSGVLLWVWGDLEFGGYRQNAPGHWWWSVVPYTEAGLWGTVTLAITAGVLVLVGLGGRASSLALLILTMALTSINPESGGGHDRLLTNALWLLVLSPASATLSLDCRLRTGAWSDTTPRSALDP